MVSNPASKLTSCVLSKFLSLSVPHSLLLWNSDGNDSTYSMGPPEEQVRRGLKALVGTVATVPHEC